MKCENANNILNLIFKSYLTIEKLKYQSLN
jgi:hypothetical protein